MGIDFEFAPAIGIAAGVSEYYELVIILPFTVITISFFKNGGAWN